MKKSAIFFLVLLYCILSLCGCSSPKICTNITDMQDVIASQMKGQAISIYKDDTVENLWIVAYTDNANNPGVAVFEKSGDGYILYHNFPNDKLIEMGKNVWFSHAAVLNKETEETVEIYFFVSNNRDLNKITFTINGEEMFPIGVLENTFPYMEVVRTDILTEDQNWKGEFYGWGRDDNIL